MRLLISIFMSLFIVSTAWALDVDKELAYRVQFGNVDDVKYLLEKGANPNALNDIGWPLVTVAASRKDGQQIPVIKALIEAGADLDQGGGSRQYPIIIAARNGDLTMMQFLLDADADITVKDTNAKTAHDIATHYGYDDIAALFDAIREDEAQMMKERLSPERQKKLIYDLAYAFCELQYQGYFISSKQEKLTEEEAQALMDEAKKKVNAARGPLLIDFGVPNETIKNMQKFSMNSIQKELDNLISNRFRRKTGSVRKEIYSAAVLLLPSNGMRLNSQSKKKKPTNLAIKRR